MRKETSTNAVNERFLFKICKLNSSLAIIGGRWRAQIIFLISTGYDRFHLLEKELPNISRQDKPFLNCG
ncbi:hypothetical protein E0W69_006490 [Rhizosphaericola mali]|uniref:HTH hxlR-type domain-containing protein n=2 Tax=Rhizosphaericola mali TaxID=2545455 RepID=A0A5P2FXW2_9BACT|nr:hypothetical protein E0W69_006490 [Rhizosphaericola mali]